MQSTCLLCCEESQIWVLPPCNHNQICWKCCLKLVQGSIFSCPFCKSKPQTKSQLLFVTTEEMNSKDFKTIMQNNPFRSNKNSYYYYSNQKVANYIQSETSFHCTVCAQVHQNLNLLKKHLYSHHRVQFCDVCLDNRRCMIGQQRLYSDPELQIHLKQGETSPTGEIVVYHPNCQFCSRRFYDLDMFKIHLKMSSHLKCQICDLNSAQHKYVYYRNFEQLQRHHKKSHFVCEVGDCIGRKMQNVFASQYLLQEHKRRFHRKHKGDKQQKMDNILLGFNKKEQQEFIQFDGIGKNISREFTVFQRHDSVQKEKHEDIVIDLREFYPEIVKANLHPRIQDIVNKLDQLHCREGTKNKQPNFAQLPLYKPLEMSNLNKHQCQRLIRKSFPPKDAEILIQLFFIKRFDYRTPQQSYIAIQKKMRVYSTFAFFLIFPQLIRNLKAENRGKLPMDQFYASRLRTLAVNRMFIFHGVERYSNLVDYTKCEVEQEVRARLQKNEIDLQVYARYLKQMNTKYYFDQQEGIYLVNSEKMTHLCHMVERCPTRQLLKMNWLLKVGLSTSSYNLLGKFYYLTKQELANSNRIFQSLTLQELSLLYAYLTICRIALLDQITFQSLKKNPKPHYLTNILDQLSQPPKISNRQILQLKSLEGHSDALNKKNYQHRVKGIIINENDCPSLLAPIQCKQIKNKSQQTPKIQDILGKSLLPTPWNQNQARKKKKPPMERGNHEQEFPTLGGKTGKNGSGKAINADKKKIEQEQEEQFPVFNFNQKYVNHKLPAKQQKESQVNNFVNFNNKTVSKQFWDQHRTRKKIQTIQTEKELIEKRAADQRQYQNKQNIIEKQNMQINRSKKNKKQSIPIQKYQQDQDQYLKLAIEQSLKTAKMEENQRQQHKQSNFEIIKSKKSNFEQMEESQTKKKKKREKKVQPQPSHNNSKLQYKQELTLFERIELEQKKIKHSPFRRDISPKKNISQVQKSIGSVIQKQERSYLNNSKGPVFEDDDFLPIGMTNNTAQKQSIVTRLIKQSQTRQQVSEAPKKQKYKKRKNRRDQSP